MLKVHHLWQAVSFRERALEPCQALVSRAGHELPPVVQASDQGADGVVGQWDVGF